MPAGSLSDFGKFPFASPDTAVTGYQVLTNTGDVTVIAAQGAQSRIYITSIIASNSSGTPVQCDIKDGSTTVLSCYLAASGGGFAHVLPYPIRLSENTAAKAAISAMVTDVRVSITGFVLKAD